MKIGGHPDSDGHDFELFGDNQYKLAEIVEFMYDVKWTTMRNFGHQNYKTPSGWLQRRLNVDDDLFLWDGEYTIIFKSSGWY